MTRVSLLVLAVGLTFAAHAGPRDAARVKLEPSKPPASHGGVEGVTRCELCHSTAGWIPARFAHERTGFRLEGAHQQASCKACHVGNFSEPLGQLCSGCHRDPHRGEFGQRCEGCHDTFRWVSAFTADAHRRTAFPLDGRHALIPCEECHGEARDRTFSRPVAGCVSCHADDYARTATSSIDHRAVGFSLRCEECHDPFRFTPAKFPQHDRCFVITRGDHANLACRDCHSTVAGQPASGAACSTGTATCTGCHEHTCARSDDEHKDVAGYQCTDRKCYECHQFGEDR